MCGGRKFGHYSHTMTDEEKHKAKLQRYFISGSIDQYCYDNALMTEQDSYGNWLPAIHIISGGAPGVDTVAIDYAVVNWLTFTEIKADWKKDGKGAGPKRNLRMIVEGKPDVVLAFPGGPGTANMVKQAKEYNIPVVEFKYEPKS